MVRVAFTSSTGEHIDQHFGHTQQFHLWEVGPDRAAFVGTVAALAAPGCSGDEDDATAARASAIAGCAIVYTQAIGGPAAAKLVARRIHPLKTGGPVTVLEAVARLQEVMRGHPPPWLRKALGGPAPEAASDLE